VKLKRTSLLLCSLALVAAVVVAVGLSVRQRRERNSRIRAAFPPEAQSVVAKSEKFYLYSLQSERLPEADLKTIPNFHGYPILGQARVHASPYRADLFAAVREDLGANTFFDCFNPHHGIRAVRGGKTVDLLLGFGCRQMEIYDERGVHRITVGAAAQRVFDHVLAEYDVPLPMPPMPTL
jgi:hypothetical protein